MAKERRVWIELDFLCADRAESSTAVSRIHSFIEGEAEGSTYWYQEVKDFADEVRLNVKMQIVVGSKSEDDSIETKLDNNISSFPELYPGTEPRFMYDSKGVAE